MNTAAKVFLLLALCCGCAPNKPDGPDDTAGGGSSRPNPPAICGIAVLQQGINATKECAEASLYHVVAKDSVNSDWRLVKIVLTDTVGCFRFDSLASGSYSLLVQKDGYKAFSGYFSYAGNGTLTIDTLVLDIPKTITGEIIGSFTTPSDFYRLGLVGTSYADTLPYNESVFQFENIPFGMYKMAIVRYSYKTGAKDSTEYCFDFPVFNGSVPKNALPVFTGDDTGYKILDVQKKLDVIK